jgi:nicotinamide riboside transporter PnuC
LHDAHEPVPPEVSLSSVPLQLPSAARAPASVQLVVKMFGFVPSLYWMLTKVVNVPFGLIVAVVPPVGEKSNV